MLGHAKQRVRMKIRNFAVLILTLALLLPLRAAEVSHGISWTNKPTGNVTLQQLVSGISETNILLQRFTTTQRIAKQREQLITSMLTILSTSDSVALKENAVVILGEYRAVEAVPFIVNNLQMDEGWHGQIRGQFLPDDWQRPMSIALLKVGAPAVPALLDKIAETNDDAVRAKCVSICSAIEGRDVAEFRLQKLLKSEVDATKKQRIQAALDVLKDLPEAK